MLFTVFSLKLWFFMVRGRLAVESPLSSILLVQKNREAVELGLKTLISLKKQAEIKQFKGKLKWDDDLERMRND